MLYKLKLAIARWRRVEIAEHHPFWWAGVCGWGGCLGPFLSSCLRRKFLCSSGSYFTARAKWGRAWRCRDVGRGLTIAIRRGWVALTLRSHLSLHCPALAFITTDTITCSITGFPPQLQPHGDWGV